MIISNHARQRFKERWKLGFTIDELALQALNEGKTLPNRLRQTIVKLGFHLDGYWTGVYKIFGDFIWVFQPDEDSYVLTTIFPRQFLELRTKKRYNRKLKLCVRCRKRLTEIKAKNLVCNFNGVVFERHNII